MQISKIAAHVRFSKDIGGSWKSVELSAEASVSDREHWKQAQSELYFQLTDQLRQLWNNGAGAPLNGASGAESHGEPPAASEPTRDATGALVRRASGRVQASTKGRGDLVFPQGAGRELVQ